MTCRGVRGATTAKINEREAILSATQELLGAMVEANGIEPEDLAAVFFTCTSDLTAAFPAEAARRLGWCAIPLLDAQEVAVPGALVQCIRVLMLWNTERGQDQIHHVYLRGAKGLRPDLAGNFTTFSRGRDVP
ncbi:MAG: chorismate mutase [Anaerolineae bacterium]|mgnify:CR=1 FL=1